MLVWSVKAGGRIFRVTVGSITVDCRDIRTGDESQAIIDPAATAGREAILADSQVRDAIASAYYNATSRESGKYPVGGTALPDGFKITIV